MATLEAGAAAAGALQADAPSQAGRLDHTVPRSPCSVRTGAAFQYYLPYLSAASWTL